MRRRPRSERGKYANRERDVDYMLLVKTLPCMAKNLSRCNGPIEADHMVSSGTLGNKGPDWGTVPLCNHHHRARTDFSGPFRTWNGPMMKAWLSGCVLKTRRLLGLPEEGAI